MPKLAVRKLNDVAAVIRAAREDRGLTQGQLAERLLFSRDYMVDLESGRPNLYIKRLLRVLHALNITMTLEFPDRNAQS